MTIEIVNKKLVLNIPHNVDARIAKAEASLKSKSKRPPQEQIIWTLRHEGYPTITIKPNHISSCYNHQEEYSYEEHFHEHAFIAISPTTVLEKHEVIYTSPTTETQTIISRSLEGEGINAVLPGTKGRVNRKFFRYKPS